MAFGLADKHSAGGKGGDVVSANMYWWGGNGGSDGDSGANGSANRSYSQSAPTYADKGGGTGGGTDAVHWNPQLLNATFYGSGGGGGSNDSQRAPDGGSGYQGVVYIIRVLSRSW